MYICTDKMRDFGTHELFSSHPLATKLPNTTSACVLDMFDLSVFTSRRAANEEIEYDSLRASMICSTCLTFHELCAIFIEGETYNGFEIGNFLSRVIGSHLGDVISLFIGLGFVSSIMKRSNYD